MSFNAMSCEHLLIFAYLAVVSFASPQALSLAQVLDNERLPFSSDLTFPKRWRFFGEKAIIRRKIFGE